MKTYSIREVLQQIEHMPNAWFYLPNTGWTLDTLGAFSLDSRDFPADSNEHLPPQVLNEGWVETLETAMIEDVISNTNQQRVQATLDDYFMAFKYYYQNDAFIVLKPGDES